MGQPKEQFGGIIESIDHFFQFKKIENFLSNTKNHPVAIWVIPIVKILNFRYASQSGMVYFMVY